MLIIEFNLKDLTYISPTFDYSKTETSGKYILKFESDNVESTKKVYRPR